MDEYDNPDQIYTGNSTFRLQSEETTRASSQATPAEYLSHVSTNPVPTNPVTTSTQLASSNSPQSNVTATVSSATSLTTSTSIQSEQRGSRLGKGAIIGVAVGGASVVGLVVLGILWWRRKRCQAPTLHSSRDNSNNDPAKKAELPGSYLQMKQHNEKPELPGSPPPPFNKSSDQQNGPSALVLANCVASTAIATTNSLRRQSLSQFHEMSVEVPDHV